MKGSFSNNSLRSRKRRCISDNSIESCKHRSRNCSKIWEPLRKSRRLSENTACLCLRAEAIATYGTTEIVASLNKKGVVTESVGDALATQEIPDVADGVIIKSSCDAVATQETPDVVDVVVTESLCDAVATQKTPNFVNGVVTQSPSDAVATQETSDAEGVVVTESPCDAVATMETPNLVDVVVTVSPCDAVATQATPPNVVDGVFTKSACDAVATQATHNLIDVVVTESPSDVVCEGSEIIACTCNASVVSEPLIGVQAVSEENIKLTVDRSSSMFVHEPAESFTEDGITNIDASEINASSTVTVFSEGKATLI